VRFIYTFMTPFHQGPPFPVSSSPILPLNVQPIRSTRPSPLSPFSLSDNPQSFSTSSGVLTTGNPHGFAPHPSHSVPSDWTGNDPEVRIDSSALGSQYSQTIDGPSYPPSRSLATTPSGWDGPMDATPYPPFPQGSDGATTFFYRSPTPSSRQRTNQACEKCRDRKTKVCIFHILDYQNEADIQLKCSGGRPTCTRCQTRGLVCEYATQNRVRGLARARRRNMPPTESPTSVPPSRAAFASHPYAPSVPTGHPRWESQSISPKGRGIEANVTARISWPLSDQSDESSDSSGVASFELSERTRYLGWSNAQTSDGISQSPRQGPNPIQNSNSHFHSMHRAAVDIKNQFCSPALHRSPSMPQLTSHETFPGASFSVPAARDPSFMEFLSPSQESLR
jgi:Fungal Zn(2)-Cys(6) binuclear cluster domain